MSIIKWAGGKKQLLPALKERMPESYTTYVEPFVGSGALFFDLNPKKAIINDFNPELINMYKQLRDNPNELKQFLESYEDEYNSAEKDKEDYFYQKRAEFNENITSDDLNVKDAALLIFLNKSCYNGLYRVNSSGLFNTPWGKRKSVKLLNEDFDTYSKSLQDVKILHGDFEAACKGLKEGSFVYFDSPYYNTFDTYQAGGFPENDHVRLATLYKKLSERGVYCLLSNSNTDFIKDLYQDYNIDIVPVKRMINCDGEKRTGTEVIIKNY